jgi:hypothetical protein
LLQLSADAVYVSALATADPMALALPKIVKRIKAPTIPPLNRPAAESAKPQQKPEKYYYDKKSPYSPSDIGNRIPRCQYIGVLRLYLTKCHRKGQIPVPRSRLLPKQVWSDIHHNLRTFLTQLWRHNFGCGSEEHLTIYELNLVKRIHLCAQVAQRFCLRMIIDVK